MIRVFKVLVITSIVVFTSNVSYSQALCSVCKDVYQTLKIVDDTINSSTSIDTMRTQIGAVTQEWRGRAARYPVTCEVGDTTCSTKTTKPDVEVASLMKYYLDILDQTLGSPSVTKQGFTSQIASFKSKTTQDIAKLCGEFNSTSMCTP